MAGRATARRRDRLAERACRRLEPRGIRDGAQRVRAPVRRAQLRGYDWLRTAQRPRIVAQGVRRRRGPRRRDGEQPRRLPRGRGPAWRAPGHPRRRVRRADVAGGAQGDRVRARPATSRAARSSGSAGESGAPSTYALLTGSSSMHHALRCAIALAQGAVGRAAAELEVSPQASSGTRWPATPRRSPTRARSRWTGTTRCSAGRCADPGGRAPGGGMERVRRARSRHQVRQRPALGHQHRDLRAGPRAQHRDRRSFSRWTCSTRCSICATRAAVARQAGGYRQPGALPE